MKPRSIALPLAILLVLTCGALAFFVYYGPDLPPNVATHFSTGGRPDGWMDRVKFIVVMSLISFTVPPFVAAMVGLMPRILPVRMINLPNREHWLAPERREATFQALMAYGLWLAALVQALLFGVSIAIARANTPGGSMSMFLIGPLFLLAFLIWIAGLLNAFGRPRE